MFTKASGTLTYNFKYIFHMGEGSRKGFEGPPFKKETNESIDPILRDYTSSLPPVDSEPDSGEDEETYDGFAERVFDGMDVRVNPHAPPHRDALPPLPAEQREMSREDYEYYRSGFRDQHGPFVSPMEIARPDWHLYDLRGDRYPEAFLEKYAREVHDAGGSLRRSAEPSSADPKQVQTIKGRLGALISSFLKGK
jgi:hypothetical protein